MSNDLINVRCPKCFRSEFVKRIDSDPLNAIYFEVICPDCDDGDFHESNFFDEKGKIIIDKES